jgi:autotransporter-associated beta strand protein
MRGRLTGGMATRALRAGLLASSALITVALPAAAQDATWQLNPGSGDFNTATNWSPATVPTGTAFFGTSNTTALSFSSPTTNVGGWTFNAGASNYTFTNVNVVKLNGAGIVVNGGSATFVNGNLLQFQNSSTAGNATITNNSNLIFANSSSAGNATITNNSILLISDTATGGTARFINGMNGAIDLSSLTSASATAGSIEGAGFVTLGSKNLVVGGNNLSTAYFGVLEDGGPGGGVGGSLTKVGTGTLTLSGRKTYTGATTVNAGTLLVTGSIAASILTTVNNGGTLGGNGTVGNTVINGGTLSPGTSIGTLTVQGSLVMSSAAAYIVEVSPSSADRTTVTGAATLGGTVQAQFAAGSYVGRSYTILSSAGLAGTTFNNLSTANLPAGFSASLSYTPTDVLLNLTSVLGVGGALNPNQQSVAGAINAFFNNGGALPPGFVSVFGLSGSSLANALTQLSGEGATGMQQSSFMSGGMFLNAMLNPFMDGRGGALAPAPSAMRPSRRSIAKRRRHSRPSSRRRRA